MRDGWRHAALGEVATLDIDRVRVEPGRQYSIAGVLNAGKGLFGREAIDGSQTNYPALHRLRSGQLVMRKLTAWEGPITCVTSEYEGFFVSAEFPTFTLGPDLLPAFMSLACQRPEFWESMKDRSTGSVQRRKRVSPSELLAIEIDLPPLAEQRRVVDLIAAVDAAVAAAGREATDAKRALSAFLTDALGRSVGESCRFSDLLSLSIGGDWGADAGSGDLDLPVYRQTEFTDIGVLSRPAGAVRSLPPRRASTRLLRPEDILLQKSAGTPSLPGRVVYCPDDIEPSVPSNFIHLLRVDAHRADPPFVFWHLWHAHHVGTSLDYQAGTSIRNLSVPDYLGRELVLPTQQEQATIAGVANAVQRVVLRAMETVSVMSSLRGAMLSALLSGEHRIPATYDRFLDDVA